MPATLGRPVSHREGMLPTRPRPALACQVHGYHWPPLWTSARRVTAVLDRHHIVPLGMGGADVPDNWVWTCPTGHRKIHAALRAIIDGEEPTGTRTEIRLAREGHERWLAAGRPGRAELAGETDPRT